MTPPTPTRSATNPFLDDVFAEIDAFPTYEPLYADALLELGSMVTQLANEYQQNRKRPGQAALITSSKAGSGKSHFLARLRRRLAPSAHFSQITMEDAGQLNWLHFFWQVLGSLHAERDSQSDCTELTHSIGEILASATSRLIAEGQIPCDSPAVASKWLAENSRKIFDGSHEDNVSVDWFKQEFPKLLPPLSEALAKGNGLDERDVAVWLDWMFRYASAGSTGRSFAERKHLQRPLLHDTEFLGNIQDDLAAKTSLRILGRLISQTSPVVFLFDGLDWFYRDQCSAMKLARAIDEIARLIPGSLCLVSVNEDTWRETFVAGLPEAIQDRLTHYSVRLDGVPRGEWSAFLANRASLYDEAKELVPAVASIVYESSQEDSLTPRLLLRLGARKWMTNHAAPVPSENASSPAIGEVLGGIRQLISMRDLHQQTGQVAKTASEFRREIHPVQPSTSAPGLTNGLRTFLARVKSRAEAKEDYLPTGDPNNDLSSQRREMILRGKHATDEAGNPSGLDDSTGNDPRKRFLRLKGAFLDDGTSSVLDHARLERLLETAGDLFPAITKQRISIPGLNDCQAMFWRFQQNEVYFGSRPLEEHDYWKKLVGCTASVARRKREQERMRIKLVVFGVTSVPEAFPSWKMEPFETPDLQFCDRIVLSPSQLAGVYAADRLLTEAPNEKARADAFFRVSGELDFFWKSVTRSVWNLVAQQVPAQV